MPYLSKHFFLPGDVNGAVSAEAAEPGRLSRQDGRPQERDKGETTTGRSLNIVVFPQNVDSAGPVVR